MVNFWCHQIFYNMVKPSGYEILVVFYSCKCIWHCCFPVLIFHRWWMHYSVFISNPSYYSFMFKLCYMYMFIMCYYIVLIIIVYDIYLFLNKFSDIFHTRAMMVNTQRLACLAFSLKDGSVKDEAKLSPTMKYHATKYVHCMITVKPLFICYNFGGLKRGPGWGLSNNEY